MRDVFPTRSDFAAMGWSGGIDRALCFGYRLAVLAMRETDRGPRASPGGSPSSFTSDSTAGLYAWHRSAETLAMLLQPLPVLSVYHHADRQVRHLLPLLQAILPNVDPPLQVSVAVQG